MQNVRVAFYSEGEDGCRAGAVATCTIAQLTKFSICGPPASSKAYRRAKIAISLTPAQKGPEASSMLSIGAARKKSIARAKCAVQERWLDPDCEYARPIDPTSSYVPTGPADLFAADKKTRDGKKMNGHSIAPATSQNGVKINGHDFFNHRGQRVHALSQHLPCA